METVKAQSFDGLEKNGFRGIWLQNLYILFNRSLFLK